MNLLYIVRNISLLTLIIAVSHSLNVHAQTDDADCKKTVVVFAASSTTNVVNEIKKEFTKQTGIEVLTSYAASAPLAKQITNGADADIFISADMKWAEYLAERQFVALRSDKIGNRLVIVTNKDFIQKIEKPEDLQAKAVEHIAIGEPDSVPAGKYAKQALKKLELWNILEDKFVSAQDVRQALMFVETGAAEAGIVYSTDAEISKKVSVAFEFPQIRTGQIVFPIILLKRGKEKSEAEMFFDFLNSSHAIKIFIKYGFAIQGK
jgi:molybdate transport system substrate-binding protein